MPRKKSIFQQLADEKRAKLNSDFDHRKAEKIANLLRGERERREQLTGEQTESVTLPPLVKGELEQLLGRPLTLTEQFSAVLDGRDLMSVKDAILHSGWQPPATPDNGLLSDVKYEEQLAAAKERVREERLAKMTEAEREVYLLEDGRRVEAEKIEAKIAEEQRRAAIEPLVDKLSEAFQFYSDRDQFDAHDLANVAKAIIALEGDERQGFLPQPPEVVGEMMADAMRPRAEYIGMVEKSVADSMAKLEGELQAFRDENGLTAERAEPSLTPPAMAAMFSDPRYKAIRADLDLGNIGTQKYADAVKVRAALRAEHGLPPSRADQIIVDRANQANRGGQENAE